MSEVRLYDQLRKRLKVGQDPLHGLLIVPDFLMMLLRISRDGRLPKRHRLLAGSAFLYVLSPVDFVPDWLFGPAGFVDDITVAVFVLHHLVGDIPLQVLEEHWSGDKRLLPVLIKVVKTTDGWLRSGMRHKMHVWIRGSLARIARG